MKGMMVKGQRLPRLTIRPFPAHPRPVETLVGVFRTLLPARYWHDLRNGSYLSILLTAALGVRIGYAGFFERASKAAEEGAALALKLGAPGYAGGVGGASQTDAVAAALMGNALTPLAFFLFTPMGWLADYLVLSAVFRGVTLAVDNPWGDPLLTAIDHVVRGKRDEARAKKLAAERELLEGPEVPDQILECRKFAGKEADFVVISCRRKEGWTLATTVIAESLRLRIGDPLEKTLEGRLRTCYPLKVIRDIQVDRRIVHYAWPKDAPPLPGLSTDSEE
jgi:nucleotide-binding universal stress UspA family protein